MTNDRINSDPAILGGKPIVNGTRISVELVLGRLARGWPLDEILREYPTLTRDDVLACLAYAEQMLADKKPHSISA